jgi:7-cyano-7-deazaguanine synthase
MGLRHSESESFICMNERRAVVLLSGGLDSATVLGIARREGYACHALTFDYGQRHRVELDSARRVAQALGAVEHRIATLDLSWIGGSALTDRSIAVPDRPTNGIPVTYVPARNTVFLAIALGWAEVLGAQDLFVGVNAVDFSGYPDCRPAFIEAFERLANVATRAGVEGRPFRIHAPLLEMTKAEIIRTGVALGINYALTLSCYDPDETGTACGVCDACRLRARGFAEAGVSDPTPYRSQRPLVAI